jgi:hypothetical protein
VNRSLRSTFLSALALALAVAASAQVLVLPVEALAPIGLPPLLVGTPAAPGPLLSSALSFQLQAIGALPAPAASAYLAERAASAAPAERAAAKLVAARLVFPEAAAAVPAAPGVRTGTPDAGLRELAESARLDPALAAWFDGGKAPSLGLDGMKLVRGTWRRDGAKLERLGQGEFGFVDVHPAVAGAIVKTVAHSASIMLLGGDDPMQTALREEATARALSAADAGPRHFGRAEIGGGYLVSVRERVFGDTLESLSYRRRLGPEERDLVLDLVRRLAAAGLKPDDLRPANVMIGRTLLDPRRRAYVVDGGNLNPAPAGLDAEGRSRDLLDATIILRGRFVKDVGWIEDTTTLRTILDRGVDRAGRVTRWQKFKGFLNDLPRMVMP